MILKFGQYYRTLKCLGMNLASCFSFVRRAGNHVSHTWAKHALRLVTEIMWKNSFPLVNQVS